MERPILFSTPMVQATLDDRKTQTRRVMEFCKEADPEFLDECEFRELKLYDDGTYRAIFDTDNEPFSVVCPYGKPGDILWVRETFYAYGHWTLVTTVEDDEVKNEWHFHDLTLSEGLTYLYESCPPEKIIKGRSGLGYFKRPSIFMPKEACRIRLEITNIRVERLQDISGSNAVAEGISQLNQSLVQLLTNGVQYFDYSKKPEFFNDGLTEKESYKSLWESINGRKSWDLNPWVWVIEFKKL